MKPILIFIILLVALGQVQADFILNSSSSTSIGSNKITNEKGDYKVIIGNETSASFQPVIKFVKKNFEDANLTVGFLDNIAVGVASANVTNGVIYYNRNGLSLKMYEKPEGFEFEAVIYAKPPRNWFAFPIETKNLEFYYQPELTEDEIKEGAYRPENVVGSYAVFHTSKKNGQYQTGKVMHIYRPFVSDANGAWVYANITITGKYLNITIPQNFLDVAKYPIYIDPTFGYTNVGATSVAVTTYSVGLKLNSTLTYTASANDRVISLHLYNSGAGNTVQMALYNMSNPGLASETLGSRIGFSTAFTGGPSAAWDYKNVSINLIAGQKYTVAYGNFSASAITTYYDSNGAMNSSASRSTTNTIPLAWVESNNQQRIYSMYATYVNEAPSSFTPAFFVNVTSPFNNSAFTYGYNLSVMSTIFGNATAYTVKYSIDEGTTNTSLGSILNGTAFNISLGYVPAGFGNLTIWALNGTTENVTRVNYTVNKASLSLSVSTSPSGSSIYGVSTTTTGSGCTSLFSQITCDLFFNRSASPIYQRASPWSGVWSVGTWQTRYNTTGNANYSSADSSDSFTITKYTQFCTLTIDGVASNKTVTEGTETTALGSASNVSGTLYRNAAGVANPDVQTLSNATYNYTFNSAGNENFTACNATYFLFVNQAQAAPFVPAFIVNITHPVNNSIIPYGYSVIGYFKVYGNATGYTTRYSFNFGASNTSIGNVANNSNTSVDFGMLTVGNYQLEIYGINGSVQNKSYVNFSIYDNVTPFLNITSPLNESITQCEPSVYVEVATNDTISTWWYSYNGGANTTFLPPDYITVVNGTGWLRVWANDTSNNVGFAEVYFTFTTSCPPAGSGGSTMFVLQNEDNSYKLLMLLVLIFVLVLII